jgi:hypothetical protein
MTMVSSRYRQFETLTVDEIFAAWEAAARAALKKGQRYAPEIFAPRGRTVQAYKRAIRQRMKDKAHPFNAADFRNSNRVAKDMGRICSIMAAAERDGEVSLDVFQRVAELAKLHAACPAAPTAGAGRWCDRG